MIAEHLDPQGPRLKVLGGGGRRTGAWPQKRNKTSCSGHSPLTFSDAAFTSTHPECG